MTNGHTCFDITEFTTGAITVQRMPFVVILLVNMNASVLLDMKEMAKPVTMPMNALLVPTIVTKPSQIV